MKRFTLIVAALTLAIPAPLAMPSAAAAQGNGPPWFVEFCKADVPLNPPFVLGDCLGFIQTFIKDTPGLIRFVCDYLENAQPDVFYAAYDSTHECIVDRAAELPPPPY